VATRTAGSLLLQAALNGGPAPASAVVGWLVGRLVTIVGVVGMAVVGRDVPTQVASVSTPLMQMVSPLAIFPEGQVSLQCQPEYKVAPIVAHLSPAS
jgi:hypothetical protein